MILEILDIRKSPAHPNLSHFDIQISANGKFKIYRNLSLWEGKGKKWVSFPKFKTDDDWIPIISFDKETEKDFFSSCLLEIKNWIDKSNV